MKRRNFLIGAAGLGAAAAGVWSLRPGDRGAGGHDDYFRRLTAALRRHDLARPTMILDLDRLDANIEALNRSIRPARHYRAVAKSLPSAPLLQYVMDRAGSERLMVFHQPFLNEIAAQRPAAEVLLGKPMPVPAADRFYAHHRPGAFDPARQVQWLIDTPRRLAEYRELARGRSLDLTVNIEIDVGLHRGGLREPAELRAVLETIDADPRLRFGGLMGYEPQVAKAPGAFGLREREFRSVQDIYRGFLDVWRERGAAGNDGPEPVFNAAGSPTFRLWEDVDGLANELAAGSGLVKPLDFDVDTLAAHVPALFIATPVLKAWDGLDMPVLPLAGDAQRLWNPNRERTFFVYGGYWKAYPVSPPGLSTNPLYGHSSNQEMLNGSSSVALEVGDYVFYRPTQSEFVMLQFGDIAVARGGEIVDFWPPLAQSG
jgi:D-serine deaminase-like pyridoxal phosphate-dependent protein